MSKSLGNTVSPGPMVEQYGADTVRLFILFAANPTAGMDWSDSAVASNHRVSDSDGFHARTSPRLERRLIIRWTLGCSAV